MTEQTVDFRSRELFPYHEHRDFYDYLAGFSILALGVLIGAMIFSGGYDTNIYTELLSVVATIAILDRRSEHREERRRIKDLQDRLIREAGSPVNEVAVQAVNELHNHQWLRLENGVLQGADLRGANLQHVYLRQANFQLTNLRYSRLEGVSFLEANLQGVNFSEANLCGADLQDANLKNALIENTQFDENTKLPDGKRWGNNTDMTQFGCMFDYQKYKKWRNDQLQRNKTKS